MRVHGPDFGDVDAGEQEGAVWADGDVVNEGAVVWELEDVADNGAGGLVVGVLSGGWFGVGDLECEGGCRQGHQCEALGEIHDGIFREWW